MPEDVYLTLNFSVCVTFLILSALTLSPNQNFIHVKIHVSDQKFPMKKKEIQKSFLNGIKFYLSVYG